jgi:hypothetical protein
VVKNRTRKLAVRRYQSEHPGMSYTTALRKWREQRDRAILAKKAVPQPDEAARNADSVPAAHYLNNPFGLRPNDDVNDSKQV